MLTKIAEKIGEGIGWGQALSLYAGQSLQERKERLEETAQKQARQAEKRLKERVKKQKKRASRAGTWIRLLVALTIGLFWWLDQREKQEEGQRYLYDDQGDEGSREIMIQEPAPIVPVEDDEPQLPVRAGTEVELPPMEPPAASRFASGAMSYVSPLTVSPESAPTLNPEPAPAESGQPDDLTIIEGVGPKVSQILNQAGIYTFKQVAEADPIRLNEILADAGLAFMNPTSWPEQARLAEARDWGALEAYTKTLRGGRQA